MDIVADLRRENDYQGCKAGVFDVSSSLFVCSLLYTLMGEMCQNPFLMSQPYASGTVLREHFNAV